MGHRFSRYPEYRKEEGFSEIRMSGVDRRKEKRLQYNWPVWYADHYDGDRELCQGQMFDITSEFATFTCYADNCPIEGELITARFSVPKYGTGNSFDMENFVRTGKVFRIDKMSDFVRKVALEFAEKLPFRPGEVDDREALAVDVNEDLSVGQAKAFAEEVSVTLESAKLEGLNDISIDKIETEEAAVMAESDDMEDQKIL